MTWSFGGHETFVIREGWLHKGLALLTSDPDALAGAHAADALGVGQNMAKSIRHWLAVTGLAERPNGNRGNQELTALGALIWREDPYFLAPGTWWALHMQLINQPKAGAWCWFFNYFAQPRFERAICVERLNQYLQLQRRRPPSRNTLERDLSTLLRCYATQVPPKEEDPEDGNDCGLKELGLLYHFPSSGVFQRSTEPKQVPAELIAYNIALIIAEARGESGTVDIPIDGLSREPGGPGAALQVNGESLYEVLRQVEGSNSDFTIAGLGAERVIRMARHEPIEWLELYYSELEEAEKDAA
jgi:hypothetical protein